MPSVVTTTPRNSAQTDRAPEYTPLPREFRALWIASLAVAALTVLVGWLKWHAGENPFNWDPLSDRLFFDLMEYPGTYTLLHTTAFFFNFPLHPWPYPMWSAVAYPPFAAVVMAPMYAAPIPDLVYIVFAAAWSIIAVVWSQLALLRRGVRPLIAILFPLTLAATSFPAARLIHQGNIELVVWIFTAVGVWAFMRERNDAAAVLWGLAAAMKLFPFILLGLLLPRGRYRAFAIGIATFIGATVLSLWWLGPTIGVAWHGTVRNVFGYQSFRIIDWSGPSLATNHSLIEPAKIAAQLFHFPPAKIEPPYYACGTLFIIFIYFKKLWRMPVANQLLALTTVMLLFPSISYYHTLVHLYAPLAVLAAVAFRAQKASVAVPGLGTTILLFVPLFASFTILTYPKAFIFCGIVQAIVLVALLLMSLEYPFAVPEAVI